MSVAKTWNCGKHIFELGQRTLVMGVLNVTPDSFSDGGRFAETIAAVEQGLRLADEGADIIDIGGESSRPGAAPVTEAEEIRRVRPVVAELLRRQPALCLSIDTTKAAVARAALAEGAAIVNDISGLEADPALPAAAAEFKAGCVIMHIRGTPRTMQDDPRYDDVVAEIGAYLLARVNAATAAGVAREALCIDPGLGFGKTNAGHFGMAEDRGGDKAVIEASRGVFEQGFMQRHSFGNGHRRQLDTTDNIAQRINGGFAGLEQLIDHD